MFAKPDEIDQSAGAGRQPAASGFPPANSSAHPNDSGFQPADSGSRPAGPGFPPANPSPRPHDSGSRPAGPGFPPAYPGPRPTDPGLWGADPVDSGRGAAAGSGLSLLSRSGPEVPPDAAGAPPPPRWLVEPTETLPVIIIPPAPDEAPVRKPPAPGVAARAVIVYEQPPRRPWRLWVFTAVIVALTIGVVLGQAVAWQPVSRTGSVAEAQVVPPPSTAPSRLGLGSGGRPGPGPGQQVTVPRGSTRARLLEITGPATLLSIRSADLGATLFHAAALDSSVVPSWTDTGRNGTRLELVRTGTPGTAGLDIQLNSRVAWTIRLTGAATERDVDMRAGGLAGLTVNGGSSLVVLRLPKPAGTVPLAVTGGVSRLDVDAPTGIPVRLQRAASKAVVTVDGAKQRAAHTPPGWKTAKNRYDLTTS